MKFLNRVEGTPLPGWKQHVQRPRGQRYRKIWIPPKTCRGCGEGRCCQWGSAAQREAATSPRSNNKTTACHQNQFCHHDSKPARRLQGPPCSAHSPQHLLSVPLPTSSLLLGFSSHCQPPSPSCSIVNVTVKTEQRVDKRAGEFLLFLSETPRISKQLESKARGRGGEIIASGGHLAHNHRDNGRDARG